MLPGGVDDQLDVERDDAADRSAEDFAFRLAGRQGVRKPEPAPAER